MKIELDKEFTAAALEKQVEKTELPDEGIVLNEPMEPENADCSVDTVPADVLDTEGRKKVRVPELISMTKVLFDRYRLPLYAYLIRCLRNGTLESLVQKKILNHTINREVAAFPYVTYWRIDRENF